MIKFIKTIKRCDVYTIEICSMIYYIDLMTKLGYNHNVLLISPLIGNK